MTKPRRNLISCSTRLLIRKALREDIGRGDLTTKVLIPSSLAGKAYIKAKSEGILCGTAVVRQVFRAVDRKLWIAVKIPDGARVTKGKQVITVRGRAASILKAERVALNFLGRLSGIATLTSEFVRRVRGTRAEIFDTRKTTPLWRALEKYAVRCGGGQNHRFGLWDEILVKDNHWIAMMPSLRGGPKGRRSNLAAQRLLRALRALAMTGKKKIPVEIEVGNLRELTHLLKGNFVPDRILLDNFSSSKLRRAVRQVHNSGWKYQLEASGGITLRNVRKVARTGVDRISVGALTHSASALDFSLSLRSR